MGLNVHYPRALMPCAGPGTRTAMTAGASFVQRSGLFDVYTVAAGTFEFSSAP